MTDESLTGPMGGYDPTLEPLDLTRDEKRRTTAIMLALSYYEKTIIHDSKMYKAIMKEAPDTVVPAHEDRVIEIAMKFNHFLETGKGLHFVEDDDPDADPVAEENPDAS